MTAQEKQKRPGSPRKPPLREEEVQGFKYLDLFFKVLKRFHNAKTHQNRKLFYDQYLALMLLYFFTPVLTSLRGIQQATSLEKVQKRLGLKKTSLSSLSEAAYVFDPGLLEPLIKELTGQAISQEKDPQLKQIYQSIRAVDGTLLPALPKMLWALWQNEDHRAAKLHLEFDIRKQVPTRATLTHGNGNEKKILKTFLAPDTIYLLDCGYAEYKLLDEIIDSRSAFVIRLRDNAAYSILEEKTLTENDRKAGIQKDLIVTLGCDSKKDCCPQPLRIIQVFHKGEETKRRPSRVSSKKTFRTREVDYTFLLATNLLNLPAETVARLFSLRWQIELFFRWFKCVLGCNHLVALSENGLTIQIYCALIASLLITLWTGRKPTKRTFEMITLHFLGWASDEELERHIQKLKIND